MDFPEKYRQRNREHGRIIFGSIVVIVGVFLLLHNLFPEFSFYYHFSWPLILVIIGLAIGIKTNFRRNAWWILILIGGVHLAQPYLFPLIPTHVIIWPGLLIAIGLVVIFRRRQPRRWERSRVQFISNDADTLNIDVTFGGRKEIITSKSFKGGFIKATFAGAEVNLSSADSGIQPMIIDIDATFAGVEIVVPGNWEVQNEINPTMGSIEDQRVIRTQDISADRRILILRGSCTFGSVEIKSY